MYVLVAGLGFAGTLSAQSPVTTVEIGDGAAPATIVLQQAAAFGESGPGVGPLGRVVVSPDSSVYAIADVFHTTEVNLYFSSGLHAKTLGRTGEGPGEYRNVMTLAQLGDSLFVYDNALGRETVYDFDGRLMRSREVPPRTFRAVPMPNGVLVVNATDARPGRIGAPLHVVDAEGAHITSFPNAGGRYRADEAPLFRRSLTSSTGNSFWAAHPTVYEIEQWNPTGVLMRRVIRHARWFRPHQQIQLYRAGVEPQPRLHDVFEDDAGKLWVLSHVPGANWHSVFKPAPAGDMGFNGDHDAYWDTIVEVLDPLSGILIAELRSEKYFSGFTSAGQLVSYHEGSSGVPYITVWNASVR